MYATLDPKSEKVVSERQRISFLNANNIISKIEVCKYWLRSLSNLLNFASSSHLACTSLEVSSKGFLLERFPALYIQKKLGYFVDVVRNYWKLGAMCKIPIFLL